MKLPGITKQAALAIQRVIDGTPDWDRENHMAGFGWLEGSDNGDPPGPCIGCIARRTVPPDLIVHAHGLSVMCFLPEDMIEKYQNHMLHCADGQFLFIDRAMAKFLLGSDPDTDTQ